MSYSTSAPSQCHVQHHSATTSFRERFFILDGDSRKKDHKPKDHTDPNRPFEPNMGESVHLSPLLIPTSFFKCACCLIKGILAIYTNLFLCNQINTRGFLCCLLNICPYLTAALFDLPAMLIIFGSKMV